MNQAELNNKAFNAFPVGGIFQHEKEHIIDMNVLKDAINKGANPNAINEKREYFRENRLLTFAVYNRTNGLHAIQFLIYKGADPSIISSFYKEIAYFKAFTLEKNSSATRWVNNCYKHNRKLKKFFKSYKVQKALIEKYPNNCYQLYECDLIHTDILAEYKHLIEATELNLL